MRQILTADQFLTGVLAVLALREKRDFSLNNTDLDRRFEGAFEDLLDAGKRGEHEVRPNFAFFVDPVHGDSEGLREALLTAKEMRMISLNNPTFHTLTIKLDDDHAHRYLASMPLPKTFFEGLVDRHFIEGQVAA